MQVAVMGPLEVRTDDLVPVPVAGAEERLLLAALTAAAPGPVDAERLVQTIWDGRPPADPQQALRALVVRLRAALEPGLPPNASGRYVVRKGKGYLLTLPRTEIDALRFTALVERGRSRLADGDAAEAQRLLSTALHLWRGEPYADWPAATFADDERRRLAAVRSEAESALAEARSLATIAPAPAPLPAPRSVGAPVARTRRVAPVVVASAVVARPAPPPRAPHMDDVPQEPAAAPEPEPVAEETVTGSRKVLLLAALLVSTLVAVVLAVRSQQTGEPLPVADETRDIRDDAERLADLSVTDGPLDISLLLAAQAFRLEETAETRNALRAALMAHPRVERIVRIPGAPQGVALSGTGPTLTFATGYDIVAWHVSDGTQPRVLMPIPSEWGSWGAVMPSPVDDAIVGVGEDDGVPWVRMISVVDGSSRLLLVDDTEAGIPVDGAITPDGRRVVLVMVSPDAGDPSASRWRVVEIDVGDGSRRDTGVGGTIPGRRPTLAVDFASDAESFVIWDRSDGAAMRVDLADGSQVPLPAAPDGARAIGWRALPDGVARMGVDGVITLLDRDGETRQALARHDGPVLDVAVAPDGSWAVSAGETLDGGELLRWSVDPTTGEWGTPERLTGHTGAILDVEVDGTGRRVVTVAQDQTAISWNMGVDAGSSMAIASLESDELLAAACAVVRRDFEPVEWNRYLPDVPITPTCSDVA